jgi:hypothetical protein
MKNFRTPGFTAEASIYDVHELRSGRGFYAASGPRVGFPQAPDRLTPASVCHAACKGNDCSWIICCDPFSGCEILGPHYLQ